MMFRNLSSHDDPGLFPVLHKEHQEYLKARAVNFEIAQAARLSSVTKHQAAPLVGWKSLSCGGLAVPYPAEPGKNDHWRIRLDEPLKRPDGKEQRWASPGGEKARPYLPPFLPASVWEDTTIALIAVEGPVKALAGIGALALPFFSVAGAETGHDREAKERGEERLHPELLLRVRWEGRKVILLWDANRATNLNVLRGEKRFARCLAAAGALVFVAELPLTPEGKDQGPDDFLAREGKEALKKVLDAARPAAEVHDPKAEIERRLSRTEKGKALSTLDNGALILALDPRWEGVLAFNEFRQETVVLSPPPWDAEYAPSSPPSKGEAWADTDDARLSVWLARHWGVRLGTSSAAELVQMMARRNPVHPVRDYLAGLRWDGIPRLDSWLSTYFGVLASEYTRKVGRWWLLSAVARVYRPGVKVDYLVVLEGKQGKKKSTACQILAGDFFADDKIDMGSKEGALALQGVWIYELAELAAITRTTADLETVKGFITRKVDHYRPPYGRRTVDAKRQTVLIGTTNERGGYLRRHRGTALLARRVPGPRPLRARARIAIRSGPRRSSRSRRGSDGGQTPRKSTSSVPRSRSSDISPTPGRT